MTFKIDFTRPHLYEDAVTLNQGNLSTNNTLRCRVVTGGNDDVTGASIVCTFAVNGKQVFESGKVVDGPRGIIDVVFPSEALAVGENTLEFLVNRVDGSVAQSPVVKYRVWQGLTTDEGVRADSNYPLLVELINQANSAIGAAGEALEGANSVIVQGEELKASVDKLKADCIASVDAFTKESSNKIDGAITQNVAKVDAAIAKCEASVVKADSAAEKAILAANNSDAKTAENIKNVNAAIAAGTNDLEVKAARVDMDGKEHGSLKERLESDLKKGKVIEETKEGTYLSFNDTVGGIVSDIEVPGNTVQDASNLANIRSSCIPNGDGTFKMSILSCGENLGLQKEVEGKYYGYNNGNLATNPTVDGYIVKVKPNAPYVYSEMQINGMASNITYWTNDLKYISGVPTISNIQTPQNCRYIRIAIPNGNKNIKLQEGTVATPYTPYQETRCDIKLPCQLEKIGYLADRLYFDKVENALCVDKKNLDFTINGSEKWMLINTRTDTTCFGVDNPNFLMGGTCISDKFSFYPPVTIVDTDQVGISVSGTFNRLIVRVKTSLAGTVADWTNYLKQNNIRIKINASNVEKIVLPQSEQIKLNSFANKTHIYTISGEVDATVKATVSKSLASTVQANTNEINILSDKIADIQGLKESQDFAYETDKGYLVCKDTQSGVVKDLKINGRSLVNIADFSKVVVQGGAIKGVNGKVSLPVSNASFYYEGDMFGQLCTAIFIPENNEKYTIHTIGKDTVNRDAWFNQAGIQVRVLNNSEIYKVRCYSNSSVANSIQCYIVKGDVSQNPPPYFEGMASVGNGNEIEVLSNNKNLAYDIQYLNAKEYATCCRAKAKLVPNKEYTLSLIIPNGEVFVTETTVFTRRIALFGDGTRKSVTVTTKDIITPQAQGHYPLFFNEGGKASSGNAYGLQIENGNSFTGYVENKQDKKPILFKDVDGAWKPVTELTEFDYIDTTKNKYTNGTYKFTINGTEPWNIDTQNENIIRFKFVNPNMDGNRNPLICDKLPLKTNYDLNINTEGCFTSVTGNTIFIDLLKTKASTVELFKSYLASNNMSFISKSSTVKNYEVNPLDLESFENATMILINSGTISAPASFKMTSSLPNTINNILKRQTRIENEVFNTFTTMFKSMLNGNLDQVAYILYPECFDRDPDEGIMTIPEIMKSFK